MVARDPTLVWVDSKRKDGGRRHWVARDNVVVGGLVRVLAGPRLLRVRRCHTWVQHRRGPALAVVNVLDGAEQLVVALAGLDLPCK